MFISSEPDEAIAAKVLPKALLKAIQATFGCGLQGCALVGGTALAGFYAGHRESDDMDLFTSDPTAQAMTVASVKSLSAIGVVFTDERTSPTYYHTLAELEGHRFTIDVVLDPNIFETGSFVRTTDGIQLANLETLFFMKVATLVSRCSEKDLYDLLWLTEHFRNPPIEDWITIGQKIDGGLNGESMLISLTGANLRLDACGFAAKSGVVAREVLAQISSFKSDLQKRLAVHLESSSTSTAIAPLVRAIRKLK